MSTSKSWTYTDDYTDWTNKPEYYCTNILILPIIFVTKIIANLIFSNLLLFSMACVWVWFGMSKVNFSLTYCTVVLYLYVLILRSNHQKVGGHKLVPKFCSHVHCLCPMTLWEDVCPCSCNFQRYISCNKAIFKESYMEHLDCHPDKTCGRQWHQNKTL